MTTGKPTPPSVASPCKRPYNATETHKVANKGTAPAPAMTGFLKGVTLFNGLTETERDALGRDFVRRPYRPGELIFQQDDPGQVLYLVESGQVRIFVEGETQSAI